MASTIYAAYTLEEQQIYKALRKSGVYKNTGSRVIIEDILLFACGCFFLYQCITKFTVFDLIMTLISFGFIFIITLVPDMSIRKQAKEQAGKKIEMRISPRKILMEDESKKWEIVLDGSVEYKIINDLVVLITPKKGVVVIPTKALPKDSSSEILSMILSGTYNR